jgi:hypothetical protein
MALHHFGASAPGRAVLARPPNAVTDPEMAKPRTGRSLGFRGNSRTDGWIVLGTEGARNSHAAEGSS